MLFQRINRTDPEKIYMIVKADGGGLMVGRPVCFHFTGTDDGLLGSLADAPTDGTSVVGIANAAIAAGDYGLVQCYGYRTDCQFLGASNFAADCGAIMAVASASSGFLSQSVSLGAITGVQPSFVYAISASTALSAGLQTGAMFIRCM